MTPRADFSCLSKKCRTDAGSPVYELPVDATRCPVCGSKRIARLFNKINVVTRSAGPERDWRLTSSNLGVRQDAVIEPSFAHHNTTRVQSPDIHSFEVGNTEQEVSLPGGKKFVRPSRGQLAEMFGVGGTGREMTPMEIQRAARTDPYSVPAIISKPSHRRALEQHTHVVKEG